MICKSIEQMFRSHPLLIGIDGLDDAGKTMFGNALAAVLWKSGEYVIRPTMEVVPVV